MNYGVEKGEFEVMIKGILPVILTCKGVVYHK